VTANEVAAAGIFPAADAADAAGGTRASAADAAAFHTQPAAITRSRKHNLYLPQMQTAVPCWIFFPSNGTSC